MLHVVGQTGGTIAAIRIALPLISFARQDAPCCSIPLDSEKALQAFCEDVCKKTLHANIAYLSGLCGSEAELYKILDEARIARNDVAHRVGLGFEHCAYDESLMSKKSARIRELATALARADHLLCTLESVLSKEPMPNGESYRTYSDRLVTWVCNTDNGNPW